MNKKLPYEEALEQQLSNMLLPDEDASWQKMQELLDKKKKRRTFFFFSTDNGKSLLSLLLVLGSLVAMHYTRYEHEITLAKRAGTPQPVYRFPVTTAVPNPVASGPGAPANRAALKPQRPEQPATADVLTKFPSLPPSHPVAGSRSYSFKSTYFQAGDKGGSEPENRSSAIIAVRKKNRVARQETVSGRRPILSYLNEAPFATPRLIHGAISEAEVQNHARPPGVAFNRMAAGAAASQPSLITAAGEQKKRFGKDELAAQAPASLFVQAGVGVQQQIPVGGQKTNAFNLNGNKNLLSDYIPSLFLRLEKERRWYVQAEFSYGSPQLVKDFSYSRQTQADSAFRTVTTSLMLKKMFYHEVPLSFNYYLRPHWSAGAGATYSWFHGAVTEKETATRNLQTQAGSVAKQIIPIGHYTDSFLYRSHTYVLVQTNYQWQNGSAGLRFSKDVQPYIRYTQPDGSVTDRKNWSLQLLLRLSLWKSQKF